MVQAGRCARELASEPEGEDGANLLVQPDRFTRVKGKSEHRQSMPRVN